MSTRHCAVCHLPGHDRRSHARRNPEGAGYLAGGKFHPVRAWSGYDPAKVGEKPKSGCRKAVGKPKSGSTEERRATSLLEQRRYKHNLALARARYKDLEAIRNESRSRRGKAMSHAYQVRLKAAEEAYNTPYQAALAIYERQGGKFLDFMKLIR